MILLTFQPKNCLADCLSKASAKADNFITAVKTGRLLDVDVKTGRLLDVDIHPNFRTLMEHKAVLCTWCRTFMHTREKDISFLNALRVSLAPTPRERPFHVMFVRNQHIDEHNELNTCEFQNQDATKNNVCTCRLTQQFLLDDDVTLGENIVFVHSSYDHFFSVFHPFLPAL